MFSTEAKLKKMFVWHCLSRVLLGGSVGRHFFFFLNIYYLHMDGNGKKKNNLRFGKKKLSNSKTGESVGNAKQTIFYFWPDTAHMLWVVLKNDFKLKSETLMVET